MKESKSSLFSNEKYVPRSSFSSRHFKGWCLSLFKSRKSVPMAVNPLVPTYIKINDIKLTLSCLIELIAINTIIIFDFFLAANTLI